jgi:hypothetical protein
MAEVIVRSVERDLAEMVAQLVGQDGRDLGERVVGGARQLLVAPLRDDARTQHKRFDLGGAEHQRRQVVAVAQDVAHAGFAVDRHARRDEVGDVAIDGALGDLELARQLQRRRQRRRRRIWMIENKRSARRMAGFSSRPPIMQARHLPRPWPLRLLRRRFDADVAAEMLAKGWRRMAGGGGDPGRIAAAEQCFRLLLRADADSGWARAGR